MARRPGELFVIPARGRRAVYLSSGIVDYGARFVLQEVLSVGLTPVRARHLESLLG